MTVLAAIQAASSYLGLAVPSSVYGAAEREAVELGEIANEAASDILWKHDWQRLKTLHTITGDGASEAFDLPTDFLRFPKEQQIWTTAQETPMTHVQSHNAWLELEVKSYELVIRAWTRLGDQIAIKPTMPATEEAKFYYQSANYADASGTPASSFTNNSDEFRIGRLPDRLLKLAIIWRWRAAKRLDYAEDLTNYELALGEEVMNDRGPRMMAVGRSTRPAGVETSYPQAVLP